MNTEAIIVHIVSMLRELPEDPLRVIYMVVRQIHGLIKSIEGGATWNGLN